MRELAPWLALIFKRPARLVIGALLIFGTLASGVALLAVSGWFITKTALVGLLLAAGVAATINLYVPGGAIRLFAVSRTLLRYLERVYNHDTVLQLLTTIRVTLFQRLARASHGYRAERPGAQWLSRLTNDVDALDTLYLRLIAPAALTLLVAFSLAGLTALLLDLSTGLVVAALLLIAFVIATLGVYARTHRLSARQSYQQDELRTLVVEHLEGFAELTAAGRAGKHGARLMRQAYQLTTEQTEIESRIGWHLAATQLCINLTAVAALWLGYELFSAGAIDGPVLVLIPIALLGVTEVYAMLPDAFGTLGATVASAARLNRDCQAESLASSTNTVPDSGLSLDARNLTLKHSDGAPVLMHFDLTVKDGERVGLIGRSGSGKSSLADVVAGLSAPAKGQVASRSLAYLTQKTVIFEDTLRANLLLGHPSASDADLWRVLEDLELAERFASEPDQLDTWLGNAGSRLSGGEARRVALARVILNPAPLMILDEPFTGLDSQTRDRISIRMDQRLKGKSVVSLAHGHDALPGVDRMIALDT